jgi:hypothetical protein
VCHSWVSNVAQIIQSRLDIVKFTGLYPRKIDGLVRARICLAPFQISNLRLKSVFSHWLLAISISCACREISLKCCGNAVHEILIHYADKYGPLINRRITSGRNMIVLYKIETIHLRLVRLVRLALTGHVRRAVFQLFCSLAIVASRPLLSPLRLLAILISSVCHVIGLKCCANIPR